ICVCSRDNREIQDFSVPDKLLFPVRTLYSIRARNEIKRLAIEQQPNVAVVQNVFPLLSPSIYHGLQDACLPIVQVIYNYRLICLNGQLFTDGAICERCLGGNYLHGILRRCYRQSRTLSTIYASSIGLHRWIGTWRKTVTLFVSPDLFLKGKLADAGIPAERIRVV